MMSCESSGRRRPGPPGTLGLGHLQCKEEGVFAFWGPLSVT